MPPYEAALRRVDERIALLKEKTRDNSRQQKRIETLSRMAATEIDLLQQGIDARRQQQADEARLLMILRTGRIQMDAIRGLVESMRKEEHALLEGRQEASRRAYQVAVTTGLLTAFLGLVTVGAFAALLNRSLSARQQAAAVLHEQREWFRATLASIGDAVMATDIEGRVTFLNPVAERLTGWRQDEAKGAPLETVFHIVNEATRQPLANPALRALREGVVVGLANHTVLIARDGTEWPIDDSAAPIRDEQGHPTGTVLVFREIRAKRGRKPAARKRAPVPIAGRLDPATGLDDPAGWRHRLVQPALV